MPKHMPGSGVHPCISSPHWPSLMRSISISLPMIFWKHYPNPMLSSCLTLQGLPFEWWQTNLPVSRAAIKRDNISSEIHQDGLRILLIFLQLWTSLSSQWIPTTVRCEVKCSIISSLIALSPGDESTNHGRNEGCHILVLDQWKTWLCKYGMRHW